MVQERQVQRFLSPVWIKASLFAFITPHVCLQLPRLVRGQISSQNCTTNDGKYKLRTYSRIQRVLITTLMYTGNNFAWQVCNSEGWLAINDRDFTICFACNRPPRVRHSRHFTYRQVRIVAVTVVNGSDDPRPPWPPSDVSDFWWFVPTDTEKPLPDQLRPSVDCHGPSLVNPPPPPRQNFPNTTPSQSCHLGQWSSKSNGTKNNGNKSYEQNGGGNQPGGFKCVAVSTRPSVSL